MISRDYCVMMARYNAWQNSQLRDYVKALPEAELIRDRGAFFGSILATLNHLLWADTLWISRFDGGAGPAVPGAQHATLCATSPEWRAARVDMDARITRWVDQLTDDTLRGDLHWRSNIQNQDMVQPLAHCVMQLFNHQTHHRGQIHAMLTATGSKAPVSDLIFLPETV